MTDTITLVLYVSYLVKLVVVFEEGRSTYFRNGGVALKS